LKVHRSKGARCTGSNTKRHVQAAWKEPEDVKAYIEKMQKKPLDDDVLPKKTVREITSRELTPEEFDAKYLNVR
jgi:hypothetical protein